MRFDRGVTLPDTSIFHLMWRAINGEFLLAQDEVKAQFLNRLFKFFHRTKGAVLVYAFTVMSNHLHAAAHLLEDHEPVSSWLRSSFSSFALWLNRRLNRRGPVAMDRYKTVVAQDQNALKRLMFYIDWNPVEAGLCNHPSEWPFSSYRFYAFGERNQWTENLTLPRWYIKLASTDSERQRIYRRDCDNYWRQKKRLDEQSADNSPLIGTTDNVKRRRKLFSAVGRIMRKNKVINTGFLSLVKRFLAPAQWESGAYCEETALAAIGSYPFGPEDSTLIGPPAPT